MAWEKVKLGDVSESCLGKMLDQQKNRGEFHPYLANVNVRWGSFDLEDLPLMKFEDSEQERYGLKYGDLVVCEGGEPGRCAIWKNQIPNMKIQKALHRVRVSSDMDYRYLFYWFLYAGKRGALDQYFTGATIKHMPGEKLKQVLIDKPPLKEQKRIADILSAYDNLIENNRKQIKLLEEAAQRLYKQWFIDLRYPGHETTKIVNGLPEGWKKGSIGDIAEFKRGKVITKGDVVEGNVPVVAGGLEPAYYHNASFTESPVITVSGSGANAGFARMYFQKIWASDCSYVDSSATIFIYFAYSFLKENKKSLDSLQKGAAQPHVYAKDINALKLNCPPKDLLVKFEKSVKPLFDKIGKCQNVIEKSKDARDRLLPKLMSKKMEV